MTKHIMATKTGEFMYDDGQDTEAFKSAFQSSVYSSYDEYMADIYWMSKNEDFRFALVYETESTSPRRHPEERQQVLINKIHAQRRYQEHLEKGGAVFDTGGSLSCLPNKKAHH
ncbi:hypothetical protein [Vibrio alginolyticus]|uniref:hypothetical protein n=1 Tax=Vibrio alginolyticus TaxID=663 RepID=UPI00072186C8|nr:hypothetical protein [Vibrio alginolyticus]ALR95632.1 hypothetical protein AT730_25650 [Vibrio alginolyticus]MBY7710409.1 hypothetical protein [Vibrio alginolyticus]